MKCTVSPREIRIWVRLGLVAIGLVVTVWSLRGLAFGGGSALNPMNVGGNGIAGVCKEQQATAAAAGQAPSGTVSTAGLSGGATGLLKQLNGGTLNCPTK